MTSKKSIIIKSPSYNTKCTSGYKIPKEPLKLWCGMIPEIYGYGLMVLELTEDQARKSLKRMFNAWRKSMHGEFGYARAMEYFGGSIFEVETGKQYYDNLGS
jgi:hypothetical protein